VGVGGGGETLLDAGSEGGTRSVLAEHQLSQLIDSRPPPPAPPLAACTWSIGNCFVQVVSDSAAAAKSDATVEVSEAGSDGGPNSVLSELQLSDWVKLDTCVTVVDASVFLDNLHSIEELRDRWGMCMGGRGARAEGGSGQR
jgi:hypothetical protein